MKKKSRVLCRDWLIVRPGESALPTNFAGLHVATLQQFQLAFTWKSFSNVMLKVTGCRTSIEWIKSNRRLKEVSVWLADIQTDGCTVCHGFCQVCIILITLANGQSKNNYCHTMTSCFAELFLNRRERLRHCLSFSYTNIRKTGPTPGSHIFPYINIFGRYLYSPWARRGPHAPPKDPPGVV